MYKILQVSQILFCSLLFSSSLGELLQSLLKLLVIVIQAIYLEVNLLLGVLLFNLLTLELVLVPVALFLENPISVRASCLLRLPFKNISL